MRTGKSIAESVCVLSIAKEGHTSTQPLLLIMHILVHTYRNSCRMSLVNMVASGDSLLLSY